MPSRLVQPASARSACALGVVGDATGVLAQGATGVLDTDEPDVPMRTDTLFDAAGLTKILAVWSSIGALWEDGTLDRLPAPLPRRTSGSTTASAAQACGSPPSTAGGRYFWPTSSTTPATANR